MGLQVTLLINRVRAFLSRYFIREVVVTRYILMDVDDLPELGTKERVSELILMKDTVRFLLNQAHEARKEAAVERKR